MKLKIFVLFSLLVTAGAGCVTGNGANTILPSVENPIEQLSSRWIQVYPNADRREYPLGTSSLSMMIIYRFQNDKFSWRFGNDIKPHDISEWSNLNPEAKIITNGIYFNENFSPTGFFINDGKRIGKGKFDENRSGLLVLSPSFKILDTKNEKFETDAVTEAAQSYPFIISNGISALGSDSGQRARRTFIGYDKNGQIYLGIIPYEAVTLYELSKQLLKTDIAWERVLNLDGGPSSGIVSHFSGYEELINSYVEVPNVIVVEEKF